MPAHVPAEQRPSGRRFARRDLLKRSAALALPAALALAPNRERGAVFGSAAMQIGVDERPPQLVTTLSPHDWHALAAAYAPSTAASPAATPATGAAAEAGVAGVDGGSLVAALRGGGHVFYVRHAATDRGGVDPLDSLGDCAIQRNLSPQGRADAETIGAAVRALGIPIGEVLASPFCRTLDTARLAFGDAEPANDLLGLLNAPDVAERERRAAALNRLLTTPPTAGTNRVVVSHASNISEVAGVSLPEGGTAVFRPVVGGTPPVG